MSYVEDKRQELAEKILFFNDWMKKDEGGEE